MRRLAMRFEAVSKVTTKRETGPDEDACIAKKTRGLAVRMNFPATGIEGNELDNRGRRVHLKGLCAPLQVKPKEGGTYSEFMTKVRLCFHDRCFDGTASAALFYRFYREQFHPDAEFHLSGITHKTKNHWQSGLFDGDENVIVDFKYSNSPKV